MTDTAALQRVLTWLSPAFPVGAFAYSAGLETAIKQSRVTNREQLENWISANLKHGAAAVDATLLATAHASASSSDKLERLSELCVALCPSSQRVEEIRTMGNSFVEAAAAWSETGLLPAELPYPVAIGAVAARHKVDCADILPAFLLSYAHAQVSVAVRLIPIGQTDGLRAIAALEAAIADAAEAAQNRTLDDLGSIGYATDIAAMAHETEVSRIFRS